MQSKYKNSNQSMMVAIYLGLILTLEFFIFLSKYISLFIEGEISTFYFTKALNCGIHE